MNPGNQTPRCIILARVGVQLARAGTILGGSTLLLALLALVNPMPVLETAVFITLVPFITLTLLVFITVIPALCLAAATGYWKPTLEILLEKEEPRDA